MKPEAVGPQQKSAQAPLDIIHGGPANAKQVRNVPSWAEEARSRSSGTVPHWPRSMVAGVLSENCHFIGRGMVERKKFYDYGRW